MDKSKEERPEWIRQLILAKMAVKWQERYRYSEIGMFYEAEETARECWYGDPNLRGKGKLMAHFGWQELWSTKHTDS